LIFIDPGKGRGTCLPGGPVSPFSWGSLLKVCLESAFILLQKLGVVDPVYATHLESDGQRVQEAL
jgi:hypothetical protein